MDFAFYLRQTGMWAIYKNVEKCFISLGGRWAGSLSDQTLTTVTASGTSQP